MNKQFRNNGTIGAILDEYEKAIDELIVVISSVSNNDLVRIIDTETDDEDCRSIQTILTHVVQSGYTYVVEIRKYLGEDIVYKDKQAFESVNDYINALKSMFHYNERLFEEYPDIKLNEYDCSQKLKTRWGQHFDVQQLMQHAIVHTLKHRRQIERFKLKM